MEKAYRHTMNNGWHKTKRKGSIIMLLSYQRGLTFVEERRNTFRGIQSPPARQRGEGETQAFLESLVRVMLGAMEEIARRAGQCSSDGWSQESKVVLVHPSQGGGDIQNDDMALSVLKETSLEWGAR